MSLATTSGEKTKPSKTVFEMMGLCKTNLGIRKTRNRRLVESGSFSAPIVDNHLLVYDECGNMVAICKQDLENIIKEIS